MTPLNKKFITINQHKMAYVDEGQGDPIVFLHGNPSSSYEWRNVLPHLTPFARCIAPDLIGMGDSEKLHSDEDNSYSFRTHQHYLSAFLTALNINKNVTLILHDWGSALGFDWAYHHQSSLKAIAYMEAFVATIDSWDLIPPEAVPLFQALRGNQGEKMVLEDNFFIETILPGGILRNLQQEEMAEYRRPFLEPGESRRPMLSFFRSIPIAGEPKYVHDIINQYQTWLKKSSLPKLFIEAEPGHMFAAHRELAKSFPNQQHVKVNGSHFVQEDSPEEVTTILLNWYQNLLS